MTIIITVAIIGASTILTAFVIACRDDVGVFLDIIRICENCKRNCDNCEYRKGKAR